MTDTPESSTCCTGKARGCPMMRCIFAVALIAILTCLSMAMWKTAWAVEALVDATTHAH
ncbi:MAG: hypothetical protein QGG74_00405 [Phycisphaerales bacterium]|nr:hypothetical protein [Phycisphaerales bacterium]